MSSITSNPSRFASLLPPGGFSVAGLSPKAPLHDGHRSPEHGAPAAIRLGAHASAASRRAAFPPAGRECRDAGHAHDIARARSIADLDIVSKYLILKEWFQQGGFMDYQRRGNRDFDKNYRKFTAYAYGVIMAAAGMDGVVAQLAGDFFNLIKGRTHPGFLFNYNDSQYLWYKGREDYVSGKFAPSSPPKDPSP